jgi:hypothetical protein
LARTASAAPPRWRSGKLAAAAGRPIEIPSSPGRPPRAGGGGVPSILLFGAPVLLVVLAVLGVNARLGKGTDEPADAAVPG